jgi:hypothetical protein
MAKKGQFMISYLLEDIPKRKKQEKCQDINPTIYLVFLKKETA